MSVLLLLNGAKGCGKSDLVRRLKTEIEGLKERQCKDRLHLMTMSFFDVKPEVYWNYYHDRALKEKPTDLYKISLKSWHSLQMAKGFQYRVSDVLKSMPPESMIAISPRDAMIYVSECVVKPAFGKEYFGQYRVDSMSSNEIAIDDSAGFVEELGPAIRKLGQDNIMLLRIHGRGSSDDDSRIMIPDGVIDNTFDIDNTGTLQEYLDEATAIIRDYLNSLLVDEVDDYQPMALGMR